MPDRKAPGWRWQDEAAGGGMMDENHLTRRVVGFHDIRFDGLSDLLMRARGASIIDIGMNRGHVAYEFAVNGARLVHGCDIYAAGVMAARHWFAELPHIESKFEVVNLAEPGALTKAFGSEGYDITLFIGVYHKLSRILDSKGLSDLVRDIGRRSLTYCGAMVHPEHLKTIDADMAAEGLKRIHTSELAYPGRPAVIWKRK